MINYLFKDLLSEIFSHLDSEDLGHMAQVCKAWKEAQQVDFLWKKFCSSLGEVPFFAESWKEKYRIMKNWGKSLTSYKSFKSQQGSNLFTILEDNTIVEIRRNEASSTSVSYSISHCSSENQILNEVKMNDLAHIIYQGFWIVCNSSYEISYFDLKTGKCVKEISLESTGRKGALVSLLPCMDKQEIILVSKAEIEVYHSETGKLKYSIDLSNFKLVGLYDINYTSQHFILYCCSTTKTNEYELLFIQKCENGKLIMKETYGNSFFAMTTFDSYAAIRGKDNTIKIYQESEEGIELVDSIENSFTNKNETVNLSSYKNWLMVKQAQAVKIWDFRTREQIASLCIPKIKTLDLCCTNGTRLVAFMQTAVDSISKAKEYCYVCYNFADRVNLISLKGSLQKKKQKKKCSVM